MTPKIKIESDGEIWISVGYTGGRINRFGLIREGEWQKLRNEVAANERKRFIFLLDHMEEFMDWIQFRGNPKEIGKLQDVSPIQWPKHVEDI